MEDLEDLSSTSPPVPASPGVANTQRESSRDKFYHPLYLSTEHQPQDGLLDLETLSGCHD